MNRLALPMIRLDNLTLGYDRHPAVHHLSAEIPAGALVAVVGPNGAGKSTLLKGLAGELGMRAGGPMMGWLFQRFLHNLRRYCDERYGG